MIFEILEIAKANQYGFTYNIKTGKLIKFGYIVSYFETQDSFGEAGLKKVIQHALSHDHIIGGWLNSENGRYYFDSCKVFRIESKAIEFGKRNQQIAIFDLTNGREILL